MDVLDRIAQVGQPAPEILSQQLSSLCVLAALERGDDRVVLGNGLLDALRICHVHPFVPQQRA